MAEYVPGRGLVTDREDAPSSGENGAGVRTQPPQHRPPAPRPGTAERESQSPMGLGRTMPQTAPQERVSLSEESVSESAYERSSTEEKSQAEDISLPDVIDRMLELKASDLHFTAGSPPVVRVNGSLRRLDEYPVMDSGMIQRIIYGAISQSQRERFEEQLELDFSYSLPGKGRFRVNVYKQRDSLGAALRMIPYEIKTLDQLGMPPAMHEFPNLPRGFVLVTGPTGSGKSTTLAALVDEVNETRTDHIMTIEDPIEFLHKHKKSIVNQREVGLDTHAFHNALKNAMREAPDVILIGEILDTTTMEAAISFAETGHLCLATLHSNNADQTLERILNFFPESAHKNILLNLALNLKAVISQRLVVGADGKRLPAAEILINTPLIRDLIRRGEVHEIKEAMDKSLQDGMQTFDQCLFKLYKEGKIDLEEALRKADSRDGLALKIRLSEGASGEHDPYADTFGEESSFG